MLLFKRLKHICMSLRKIFNFIWKLVYNWNNKKALKVLVLGALFFFNNEAKCMIF